MENFVISFIFVVGLIFNIIFLIVIAIKEKNIEYQKKIIKDNKDIYVRKIPNTENTAVIAFVAMLCLAGGIYGSNKVGLIIGIIMSIALVYAIFILIRLTIKMLQGRKILNYTEKFDFSKPGTSFVKRFLIESITGKKQIEYSTKSIMAFMTKKGLLEKEEWKAFKRFLKDYTLIKEYKRESIVINKEFLVYATLFGIADKVQDDLGKFKPIIIWNY